MNKFKVFVLIVGFAGLIFLIYQKPTSHEMPHCYEADTLRLRVEELEEEVAYYKQRELTIVTEGGKAKEKAAELEFLLSKYQSRSQQPIKPNPNPNEKIVPISKSASEYYNGILAKRYQNN